MNSFFLNQYAQDWGWDNPLMHWCIAVLILKIYWSIHLPFTQGYLSKLLFNFPISQNFKSECPIWKYKDAEDCAKMSKLKLIWRVENFLITATFFDKNSVQTTDKTKVIGKLCTVLNFYISWIKSLCTPQQIK